MWRPVLLAIAISIVGWSIIVATTPDTALNPNGIAVKRFWQALNPADAEGGEK